MTTVAVLASLDTKADEAAFLADAVRRAGATALVVDTSAGGGPDLGAADVSAADLAHRAGLEPEDLAGMDRAPAVRAMADAAADHVGRLVAAGEVDALLGAGGSNAALVFARVAQRLPFGVPKVVVTTMAVVDARAVVGDSDVTLLYPVVDVDGLNTFSRTVLAQAGAAVVAMAAVERPGTDRGSGPVVGATMFGVTTPCVQAVRARLEAAGDEVVVFHANGTGGRSLESLAAAGAFDVVVDVTTTELADLEAGGTLSAGPDRLDPDRSPGVPRVVVPGAVDMANFGAPDTVPPALADRTFHLHNDNVSLMRTDVDENARVGQRLGAYVAARRDAVAVLPLRGVSALDREGGPFWWPEADAALFDAIRAAAPDATVEVDAHVNDPAFADHLVAAVDTLRRDQPGARR